LDNLNIQGNAALVLEVYDRGSYQRFDFGTVDFPSPPKAYDRVLSDIQEVDFIKFRLRAIDTSESIGRIVGSSTSIRVWADEVSEDRQGSLLPVGQGNIGDAIWQINFEVEDGNVPELIINEKFDKHGIALTEILRTDTYFTSLIYPAALNTILTEAIIVNGERTHDGDNWEHKWIGFALKLSNIQELPDDANPTFCKQWINEVISQFSNHLSMLEQLITKIKGTN
jgi:hypothetical protein